MELIIKQGYKQTEVGLIPEDWKVKALGDVGDVQMCKRIFSYQTSKRGDVPFYKIGTFGKEPDAYIDWDLYQEFRKKYSFPKKGYLLISASGTIGRTVEYLGEDAYYQDSNIIWIDNDEKLISNKYLNYTLQVVKYNTEGSTIKRLYNSIIKSSRFVIPPTLTEQKAIATALSDVDELISSLELLITKKKATKQGAMQQLLTPPHIGGKRLAGFSGEWKTRKIGDIFKIMAGGDLDKSNFSRVKSEEYKYSIYANSLVNEGRYGYTRNPKFNENSVTVTARGSLGHAEYRKEPFDAIVRLLVLEPTFKLYGFFFSEYINNKIEFAYESTGVPQLTAPQISKYDISFPKDLEEQKAIAKILSDIDADIELLRTKKAKYQSIKQGMMQELLTGKTRLV
jgi:type I restriction enzyme S subunit